jgi:hypothetical protein
MYTNVNLAAPIGALAFLGTGLLLLALGFVLIFSLLKHHPKLKKLSLLAIAGVAGVYLILLLSFSLVSRDQVLAQGQEKHFCEIDCHLAYSVTEVHDTKTLGEAPNQITAAGMFRVVTVKTRFDETTTSRSRGDALLYPNSRVLSVSDANGNEYLPSTAAMRVLEAAHVAGTPMTVPLRPADSYSTTVVFDLPADVKNPTLWIREGEIITHLIIGHENSPLHKPTRFQI